MASTWVARAARSGGLTLLAAACTGRSAGAPSDAPAPAVVGRALTADSIVLERTLCYGTCPAYRISLDRAGRVRFESRNPGEAGRVAADSVSPEGLLFLEREAARIGFAALPERLEGTALCRDWATDHPTVTVTLYAPVGVRRVVDYHGCFERSDHSTRPAVEALRTFERTIDGVTASYRWVQPAQRR